MANSLTWDYIYKVDQSLRLPNQVGLFPNDSTINCGLDGLPPLTLPDGKSMLRQYHSRTYPVVGGSYIGGCDGTITYTYTYTNCPGVQFIWTYTYSGGVFSNYAESISRRTLSGFRRFYET
ncbi:MAG: hypothetical protein IPN60_15815 [Saprospiraceae bacterium]|nr:hypothetical protein [Candidatus Opimibacter skivensis]